MKNFVFRNYTIEYLFDSNNIFSGYGDINLPAGEHNSYIVFYQTNPGFTPEQLIAEVADIESKVNYLVEHLPHEKRLVIFTLKETYNHDWDIKARPALTAIKDFNSTFLKQVQQSRKGIKIIDINAFVPQPKEVSFVDWKFFYISQMIINPKLAKAFKSWYGVQLNAINLVRKKCIVLDCDNTLWGGVVGEDGVHGIKLGIDYPGICYKQFQELLTMAASKGIIIAVCSKNNEADVLEVWNTNTNNILNAQHISCHRINWQDKATNIKEIAEELNIGLDSLVFIDDNPVERSLVKSFLPDVTIPEFPQQPYELVNFFWEVYNQYFLTYELSEEDVKKTAQYKENFARKEAQKTFGNMDDYLRSLHMEVNIFPANDSNISRIAQMTQKTNQFNLTTRRYTQEDIVHFLKKEAYVFCAGVKDKFGDNGITIAGIIQPVNDEEAYIDSYLLSCRILGREIEIAVLRYIFNLLHQKGIKQIKAAYIPTKKNILAADFYDKAGFTLNRTDADGTKHYSLLLNDYFNIKDYYKINAYGA